MADRGIIFSAPMVRALLEGRKTQTRRLCKAARNYSFVVPVDDAPGWFGDEEGETCFSAGYRPGDRLYVREAWRMPDAFDSDSPVKASTRVRDRRTPNVFFEADGEVRAAGAYTGKPGRLRPSIHMPRWASRLWLQVTDVRVQRLHEITDAEACAEGIEMESADPPFYYVPGIWPHSLTAVGVEEPGGHHAMRSYAKLWGMLHTKPGETWDDNPWVVAVTFEVRKGNIDAAL